MTDSGLKIALLDDSKEYCALFRHAVNNYNKTANRHEKIELATYENPEAFLSEFKFKTYDIVLLDIHLGKDLSGFDVFERIKGEIPNGMMVMMQSSSATDKTKSDYILTKLECEPRGIVARYMKFKGSAFRNLFGINCAKRGAVLAV